MAVREVQYTAFAQLLSECGQVRSRMRCNSIAKCDSLHRQMLVLICCLRGAVHSANPAAERVRLR